MVESSGKTVLIVEDTDSVLRLVKMALEADGHEILLAKDFSEAVQHLLSNKKIDAIVTDFQYPHGDNAKLMAHIDGHPDWSAPWMEKIREIAARQQGNADKLVAVAHAHPTRQNTPLVLMTGEHSVDAMNLTNEVRQNFPKKPIEVITKPFKSIAEFKKTVGRVMRPL